MAELPPNAKLHRNYCLFLRSSKYNRNVGCKLHDNAYGIRGGGDRRARAAADKALYAHMRENHDPLALPAYVAVRLFGWLFFNYHGRPWRGQLLRSHRGALPGK